MIGRIYQTVRFTYWKLLARVNFQLRGVSWPTSFTVKGPIGISRVGSGRIEIGKDVIIVNDSKFNRAGVNHPTQLVAGNGAVLTIGDNTGISGASIYCREKITIGNNVLLGVNCSVYDSDFHPVDYLARRNHEPDTSAPVTIEDDVWLAANCMVLKGVTVGARSVLAAGSIVTKDIPPDSLAGGVPAKVIRSLKD